MLIETKLPGVTTRLMGVQGVLCSGTTFIDFDNVKVHKSNLIGEENEGFKLVMYNFNQERMGIGFQALSGARAV